jgi:hypothetical protein
MTAPRSTLATQLKIQFELPPYRPTASELDAIIRDASALRVRRQCALTRDEWHSITMEHVRFEGRYVYRGLNFQDLNALLANILAQSVQSKGNGR